MTPMAADEATPAADAAATPPATAGAALRRAREARGLHIAALAATLKVPQSKLEALEADRYHDLPDATFARALARSMCRVLKIEAEPVLALLPSSGAEAALDRVTPGLNQPFRERSVGQEPVLSADLLKRPAVLGVGVLLVAAIAVYAIPSSWIDQLTQRFQSQNETPATPGPGTGTAPAAADVPPVNVEAPNVAASEVTSSQAGASVSTLPPQTSGANQPVAASPASPTAAVPSAQTSAQKPAEAASAAGAQAGQPIVAGASAPGTAPLKIRISAESWIEVVDAKGQVLVSRLLRPGDLVDVNGVAPLRLRVGNVSGTELVFRGQPVDLAARARDNVARLELN